MPAILSNMFSRKNAVAAVLLLPLLTTRIGNAAELPLWELGAGVAGLRLPDYRGADESSTYLLPVPYLVYRGEVVQADRGGIRGMLFERDRVQVNISINGTPPARSDHNVARRGMADLKPVFEVGPTVDLNLWRSPDRRIALDARAPLRAGMTAQTPPRHIGWRFSPGLNLHLRDVARIPGWNANLAASALFADRRYHAHFYGVDAADALADRPAYRASAGYGGMQWTMSVSKRFPAFWAGGFLRYDSVAGAAFADSPLVRTRHGVSAGVALIWVFKQSAARVDVTDRDSIGEPAY
jgi:MipA family protein